MHRLLGFLALAALPLHAVEFDSAFSSGMVLQRDLPVRISGTGAPGREVAVSFAATNAKTVAADNGAWSVEFPPLPAGGPYEIKATDGLQSVVIDDVLLGDVWLCAGQSNMQMGLAETVHGAETMTKSPPDMRILTMPRGGAEKPSTEFDAKWRHASPDALRDFSAVACYFALALKEDPSLADVPIGVINSSFGGTAVEAWMSEVPELSPEAVSGSMFGIAPTSLFNGMIAPLVGLKLRGVTWYQGEANAGHPGAYAGLLSTMIAQWREAFAQPDLPFFIVQLPAFAGRIGDLDFSWLREAQARACAETPDTWLAVTYDTTDGFDLHPREKQEIGRRLALLAKRQILGTDFVARGPAMTGVKGEGDRLTVTFDQAVQGRDGKAIKGFAIAGEDGDFRFAEATAEANRVSLQVAGMKEPKSVRYAWGGLTDANLVNGEGLPAAPFRTDARKPESIAFQPQPTTYRIEAPDWQLESNSNGNLGSFVIRGKQFLSNEPGGGTSIPVMFGSRNLVQTRPLGPSRMAFADDRVSVEVAGAAETMEWTVTNSSDEGLDFRITLAPSVEIERADGAYILRRDEVCVALSGVDRVDGATAVTAVPAHASRTVRWKISAD